MKEKVKWAALFSHTGGEIVRLSNKLKRVPDVIITNNTPGTDKIHEGIRDVVYTKKTPDVQNYEQLLQDYDKHDIITLHGWMRIIPPAICRQYNIYNLHPGLITEYPELKGKDPQQRVATCPDEKRYTKVGCVIHKVTGVVDDGPVVMSRSCSNNSSGEKDLTETLHRMAGEMWLDVLGGSHGFKKLLVD